MCVCIEYIYVCIYSIDSRNWKTPSADFWHVGIFWENKFYDILSHFESK